MEQISISSFGDDNTVKLSAQCLAFKMFVFPLTVGLQTKTEVARQLWVTCRVARRRLDLPCRFSSN